MICPQCGCRLQWADGAYCQACMRKVDTRMQEEIMTNTMHKGDWWWYQEYVPDGAVEMIFRNSRKIALTLQDKTCAATWTGTLLSPDGVAFAGKLTNKEGTETWHVEAELSKAKDGRAFLFGTWQRGAEVYRMMLWAEVY